MRKWRSCLTIVGVGLILLGLLLLIGFITGYDPTGVSNRLGVNLLLLLLFLAGFWGLGIAALYIANRRPQRNSERQ